MCWLGKRENQCLKWQEFSVLLLWMRDPWRFPAALLLIVTQLWLCGNRAAHIYKWRSFFDSHHFFLWGLLLYSDSGRLVIFTSNLLGFLFLFKSRYLSLVVGSERMHVLQRSFIKTGEYKNKWKHLTTSLLSHSQHYYEVDPYRIVDSWLFWPTKQQCCMV